MPYSNPSRTFAVYERRTPSRCVKGTVWGMTLGRCWYCGSPLNPFSNFVVEHIVPLCCGGSDDVENLAPSCTSCNQMKGTKLVEEWRETHDCKCNVLDSPYGEGRFWFELENDGLTVDKYDRWRREYDRVTNRNHSIQGHYCEDGRQ